MRINNKVLPSARLLTLITFASACALVFGYLWINSGGRIVGVSKNGYQVSLSIPQVSNLVFDSDVMMAGVKVGAVSKLDVKGNDARVTMRLTSNAPLHEGATVQVREKTLIEETYLEITDGRGATIRNGGSLPTGAGKPDTTLNDVLVTLNAPTRKALGSVVDSLGAVSVGSRQSISDALSGLGDLGAQGKDVLAAVSAQSGDLQQLTTNSAALLTALNTRQGEIAALVRNADILARTTAGAGSQISAAVSTLPDLLNSASTASASLKSLAVNLGPVAANLQVAAPDLNAALVELPQTSSDLKSLLPSLTSVLDSAPTTLKLVPAATSVVDNLIPSLKLDLSDVNPMLGYLEPYGHDLAAFFTNFGESFATGDAAGNALRVFVTLNEESIKDIPVNTNIGPLNKLNPYPAAGQATNPGPWNGTYPRVQADPAN